MSAYSFQYRVPGLQKVSAQIAGEECMKLESSEAGLSPATLVEASRPLDAPLHDEFEWDDTVAAEKYRQKQAQGIIRNIKVIVEESTEPARAFINIRGDSEPGNYKAIQRVLNDDEWREQMMRAARFEMTSFICKYRQLKELTDVIGEMEKALSKSA